jgi:hypothetical protein
MAKARKEYPAYFYPQLVATMRAAGMQEVTEIGAIDVCITFAPIDNSPANREKYAALLGGKLNDEDQIAIPLPNGTAYVYLTDEDMDSEFGTVHACYLFD